MKQMPMIEKFMSTLPYTIDKNLPVRKALDMMKEYKIRHLPVEYKGELVGVVTNGDIDLANSFEHPEELMIGDIMTLNPYSVSPHTGVDDVVLNMAEHKISCAIIQQDNGKVVGIFTANDGLRVLGEVLKGNFKPIQ